MTEAAAATAFAFDADNSARAQRIVARYPGDRRASAVLPLLDLAQRQSGGWLPRAAIEYIADYLAMPNIRVHEVATFYSMFNLQPVGKYFVQVCRTTPCWLRGSDDIVAACERFAECRLGDTSADGLFTLVEVECLGACCNAPMVQINDDYFEDLTPQTTADLLNALKQGRHAKPGSQAGRMGSEPVGGRTTLLEIQTAATAPPAAIDSATDEPSDDEPSEVEPSADEDLAALPPPADASSETADARPDAAADDAASVPAAAPTTLPVPRDARGDGAKAGDAASPDDDQRTKGP